MSAELIATLVIVGAVLVTIGGAVRAWAEVARYRASVTGYAEQTHRQYCQLAELIGVPIDDIRISRSDHRKVMDQFAALLTELSRLKAEADKHVEQEENTSRDSVRHSEADAVDAATEESHATAG